MRTTIVLLLLSVPVLASAEKSYGGGKGGTWDCKKDPVVSISHGSGKYTFKGECQKITLEGGDSTLKIASVSELNIEGGHNKITLGVVDAINIDGDANTITWKKAKSGDQPTVHNSGDDNSISQVK